MALKPIKHPYPYGPIVKDEIYIWRDYFRPRWKVLDALRDSYLWGAYFWTKAAAIKAREKESKK